MNLFDFDAAKSESSNAKHGGDFVEAQSLWNEPMLLERPAKTDDDLRFLVIGRIDENHWSATIIHRSSHIRLISVQLYKHSISSFINALVLRCEYSVKVLAVGHRNLHFVGLLANQS